MVGCLSAGGTVPNSVELTRADFSDPLLGILYETILTLRNEGAPVEPLSIQPRVETQAWLLFLKLQEQINDPASTEWYAQKVYSTSKLRGLKRSLAHVADASPDLRSALEGLEALLMEYGNKSAPAGFATVHSLAHAHVQKLQSSGFNGLETGLKQLDSLLLGLRPGHVYSIGGRTSNGKTMFAMLLAHLLSGAGHPVAYFLLETTGEALAARALGWESGLPTVKLQRGDLNLPNDWDQLNAGVDRLADRPLYIDAAQDLSTRNLRGRLLGGKVSQGISCGVIDHLTLVNSVGQSPREQATAVSRAVSRAAKDGDMPILLLSQFARRAAYERPALQHFKESGSIEEDSDVCILVYRHAELPQGEAWYADFRTKVAEMNAFALFNPEEEEIIWVEVAKNRPNGRLGLIPYALNRKYGTLREI